MTQQDKSIEKFMSACQWYAKTKESVTPAKKWGFDKLAAMMQQEASNRKLLLRPLARQIAQERERQEIERVDLIKGR